MPNYGVIDLGSNSVRLCVYEVKDDKKEHYSKKDFHTLLNNKAMAGLSAHVEEGIFTDRGIERAVDVLRGHQRRLKYFNCKRSDVFATAVLRNATNSKQVIQRIEEATGFSIKLLSEQEEAHLGFRGASSDQILDEGTLIDIGGGSTELTRIHRSCDSDNVSLNHGSLSIYVKNVRAILPSFDEAEIITSAFKKKLRRLDSSKAYHHKTMYGIGGSLRAAAKVYAEVFSLGKRPDSISLENLTELISSCLETPNTFAHLALKAAPERIHTVIPGCLIARCLMEYFEAQNIILCKNGLREGYLIERILLDASK